jgi:3-methyladenine DNA glycosylase AlkD
VKKAITLRVSFANSWALREIGQRSPELNAAAVTVARRLQEADSRAARSVGADALRELTSEKVAQRIARR